MTVFCTAKTNLVNPKLLIIGDGSGFLLFCWPFRPMFTDDVLEMGCVNGVLLCNVCLHPGAAGGDDPRGGGY